MTIDISTCSFGSQRNELTLHSLKLKHSHILCFPRPYQDKSSYWGSTLHQLSMRDSSSTCTVLHLSIHLLWPTLVKEIAER